VAAGRDLFALKQGLEKHETPAEQQAWIRSAQQWERYDLRAWTPGDLPERIDVTEVAGTTLCAFPGLERDDHAVHLKLFRKREEAEAATRHGFVRLIERALEKELAWAQKDLRSLEKLRDLYAGLTTSEELQASAYANLVRHLIRPPEPVLPLRAGNFEAAIQKTRGEMAEAVPKLIERVGAILRARMEIVKHRGFVAPAPPPRPAVVTDLRQLAATPAPRAPATPGLSFLRPELDALVPKNFVERIPFDRLPLWPRYLKALQVRADRALLSPGKDAEKAKQLQPYLNALRELSSQQDLPPKALAALAEFRWLVEEFKVSVFAQELGTAQPVSAKRLDAQLAEIRACR
jgi:ATP-dependent helicase HrpA